MASNLRSTRSSNGARPSAQRAARQRRQQPRTYKSRKSQEQGQPSKRQARRPERESRADVTGGVLSTIRANPLPALMIGTGLTWLLLGNRIGSMLDTRMMRGGRRRLGELGETFTGSFGSAAEGAASTVRDGLVTIGEYGKAIREGAGAVGRGARRAVSSTADAVSETWDSHALAVCAAALAAGITAGMLLPATSRENRAMGRASEALAKQARRAGAQVLKRGKRVASEAVEVAGREARRQGLTPTALGARVKRVASKARDAITPD